MLAISISGTRATHGQSGLRIFLLEILRPDSYLIATQKEVFECCQSSWSSLYSYFVLPLTVNVYRFRLHHEFMAILCRGQRPFSPVAIFLIMHSTSLLFNLYSKILGQFSLSVFSPVDWSVYHAIARVMSSGHTCSKRLCAHTYPLSDRMTVSYLRFLQVLRGFRQRIQFGNPQNDSNGRLSNSLSQPRHLRTHP